MNIIKYKSLIRSAIKDFWDTRTKQKSNQSGKKVIDQTNRSAVTGAKQFDGFLKLLRKVAIDSGIPNQRMYLSEG
jgi:hypothetical protein